MKIQHIILGLLFLFSCKDPEPAVPPHTHRDEIDPVLVPPAETGDTVLVERDADTVYIIERPAKPQPQPSPKTPEEPKTSARPKLGPEWTTRDKNSTRRPSGVNTLISVRTSTSSGYDRIVFEFSSPEMPAWHAEYVDRPVYKCGSGDVAPLEGDAWLKLNLEPVNAHTEEGKATIGWREKKYDNYRNLLELERTCDFEAVNSWVAGVKSPRKYRVMELKNPTRIVLDISNY